MPHTLELPDEVYRQLELVASQQGLTPAQWVRSVLPGTPPSEQQALRNSLTPLIGAFDSALTQSPQIPNSGFGEIIAEKLRRQGLQIP